MTKKYYEHSYVVKLRYFKASGKWYSSGNFNVPGHMELYQIWDKVRQMSYEGDLPGLGKSENPYTYLITVDVPNHPNEHPHLIVPEQ